MKHTHPSAEIRDALDEVCLRYVSDASAGFRRARRGKSFVYFDARGRRIRGPADLRRIRSLVIPPAWRNVWICPTANGHIQATGRDARGRKQYRYHPRWNEFRSHSKYDRMVEFARALPRIRKITAAHLRQDGLTRQRVLASTVRILDETLIRVGCEEYARDNDSYGLATIRRRHVRLKKRSATLEFRGKSGQNHAIEIDDPRVMKIVRRCHELPGHELFKFRDEDGELRDVSSGDINDYIREVSGTDFSSKDFRTWGGTVQAVIELAAIGYGRTQTMQKRNIVEAVRRTAARLGNRPATCRKYYIHPVVFDAYEKQVLIEQFQGAGAGSRPGHRGLNAQEKGVLGLLKRARRNERPVAAQRRRAG